MKTLKLFLFLACSALIASSANATLDAYYDIQVTRLQYAGESSDACSGPDPRWKVSVSDDTDSNWYGETTWSRDNISPTYTYDISDKRMRSVSNSKATRLDVRLQGWEEDDTSGDDGKTGYTDIADIYFRNESRSAYNTWVTFGWYEVSSSGYIYRVEVKVLWYYTGTVPAPLNVSATDGTSASSITVSWNSASDAEYYEVYRSTTNNSASATRIATDLTGTSYSDTSVIRGTTYYYWVKAYRADSSTSAVKSATLSGFSSSDTGTLAKSSQTITFNALSSATYGDASFNLSATASSGLDVTFSSLNPDVATVSGSSVTIVGAGTATIRASQAGNSNYNAAPNIDRQLVVNKATPSATLDPQSITYNGAQGTLGVSPAINHGSVSSIKYSRSGQNNWQDYASAAGVYDIRLAIVGDANYNDRTVVFEHALTVTAAPLSITANNLSKTYGTDDPTLTYAVSGLVEGDSLTGTLSREAGEDVGTYIITQGALSAGSNYNLSFAAGELIINTATASITLLNLQQSYTGSALAASYATEPSGLNVSVNYSSTPLDAGSYAVTATVTDSNYTGTASDTLVISPADLTITATEVAKTYGDEDPELTYETVGLLGEDTLSGELEREAGEGVGAYAIEQGSLEASDNYTLSFQPAQLTITPKPLNVMARSQSKRVSEADPLLTYVAEGLVEDDQLTGALERAPGTEPGVYAITQGTLAASENYNLSFTGANFTILDKLQEWREDNFGDFENEGDGANNAEGDSDGLSNLQEFAFGLDPNANDASPLEVTGSDSFKPGIQILNIDFSDGLTATTRFVRYKDAASIGLTYTAQFSNDLTSWESQTATPSIVAVGTGDYEVVEVEYPLFLSDGRKARFARINLDLE